MGAFKAASSQLVCAATEASRMQISSTNSNLCRRPCMRQGKIGLTAVPARTLTRTHEHIRKETVEIRKRENLIFVSTMK